MAKTHFISKPLSLLTFPCVQATAVPSCTGASVSLPDTPTAHDTRSGGLSRSGPPETRGPPLLSAIPGLGTRTYGTDSGEAGRVARVTTQWMAAGRPCSRPLQPRGNSRETKQQLRCQGNGDAQAAQLPDKGFHPQLTGFVPCQSSLKLVIHHS